MKSYIAMIWLALLCGSLAAHYACPDEATSSHRDSRNYQFPEAEEGIPMLSAKQVLHPGEPGGDLDFGRGLALDGDTLAIAQDERTNGNEAETVEVFTFSDGFWQHISSLVSPSSHQWEHFYYPALDGNALLVGAWGHCSNGPPDGECANGCCSSKSNMNFA